MAVKKRVWRHGDRRREAWSVDIAVGPGASQRIRRSGFGTRREAEEWEREERGRLAADARLAGLPAAERRRLAAADRTVADLAKSWLRACKDGTDTGVRVEVRTYRGYEGSVRLHIVPRIGATTIANIDGPKLNEFRAQLMHDTSPAMTQRVLRHTRQMLNHAVRIGWINASPGTSIRHKVDGRVARKLRMPTEAQFAKLLDAVEQLKREAAAEAARCVRERPGDPRAGAMYASIARSWASFGLLLRTLAATGLRISEVLAVPWRDMRLGDRPTLRVAQRAGQDGTISHPKSGTSHRTVAIPRDLARQLLAWRLRLGDDDADFVFGSPEGRVQRYPNLYRRQLVPAMRRAGLAAEDGKLPFALHAPQHFHASALIAAGLRA